MLKKQGTVVRFLSGVREFALLQASRPAVDPFWHPIACVPGFVSLGRIDRSVKPTANLCQSLRLRISGAIPPLPSWPAWHAQGQVYVYICQRSALGITQSSVT
jgi:hypothetical protein